MADVRTTRFELEGFRGELLHPGDDSYDDARKVFNGTIDRSPALVARCAGADDVAAVVKLAGAENLPLSVYGGGHGVTGSAVCDAGLCVDLRGTKPVSPMTQLFSVLCTIDVARATPIVQRTDGRERRTLIVATLPNLRRRE